MHQDIRAIDSTHQCKRLGPSEFFVEGGDLWIHQGLLKAGQKSHSGNANLVVCSAVSSTLFWELIHLVKD